MNVETIKKKAAEYRNMSAENLSRIVRIPSFSGQEKEVIAELEKLCRTLQFDEVRIDGLGSLIARVGSGKKKLVIDAHIDTVGVGDPSQWKEDPFSGSIRDGLVYGRGASDQKGGAAAMLTAGRILKDLNYAGDFSVYFTFTVLEEDCDGMCWKYLIEEEKFVPDFFVSTEPTSCNIYRGHRGRMEMEVLIKGLSAHGSAPERGVNAAYKAARAALALEKLNETLAPDSDNFLGKGTLVVSQMKASGPSQCAVPDMASLYIDRRLTWGETKELAVKQVKEAVSQWAEEVIIPYYDKPGWKGTPYGQELYFPTWKLPLEHPFVQGGIRTYWELFGKEPLVNKWTFSTNGTAVCGRYQVPTIGFGPGDEAQAHAPNEVTRVKDLEIASAFYAFLPYVLERSDG
ncbi:MAG: YgeY family selenium metabolism-linked hydrolase [Spirochaetales bacterium]